MPEEENTHASLLHIHFPAPDRIFVYGRKNRQSARNHIRFFPAPPLKIRDNSNVKKPVPNRISIHLIGVKPSFFIYPHLPPPQTASTIGPTLLEQLFHLLTQYTTIRIFAIFFHICSHLPAKAGRQIREIENFNFQSCRYLSVIIGFCNELLMIIS